MRFVQTELLGFALNSSPNVSLNVPATGGGVTPGSVGGGVVTGGGGTATLLIVTGAVPLIAPLVARTVADPAPAPTAGAENTPELVSIEPLPPASTVKVNAGALLIA